MRRAYPCTSGQQSANCRAHCSLPSPPSTEGDRGGILGPPKGRFQVKGSRFIADKMSIIKGIMGKYHFQLKGILAYVTPKVNNPFREVSDHNSIALLSLDFSLFAESEVTSL